MTEAIKNVYEYAKEQMLELERERGPELADTSVTLRLGRGIHGVHSESHRETVMMSVDHVKLGSLSLLSGVASRQDVDDFMQSVQELHDGLDQVHSGAIAALRSGRGALFPDEVSDFVKSAQETQRDLVDAYFNGLAS